MKPRLMYVELKTGFNDDGPAWIGKAFFSKTGKTIYFNGKAFQGGRIGGNHHEVESRDIYWISGIKKDGSDRHWAGSGKIKIDKSVVLEYLAITREQVLLKSKFEIVELDNNPPKEAMTEIANRKL
ncbi:hypothetical protein ACX0G9_30955 [Flavitalea flava]